MVGNIPNFTKIDILRCFLRLNRNIGRKELARELELGEGTIRTILNILKSKKLLGSTKKGHFLSNKGINTLNVVLESMGTPKKVSIQNLYPKLKKAAIVVKNIANLNNLYKLRDLAVKNGAEGAIILKFEGRLYAPESDYKQDYRELEEYFKLKNNDVVVVAFSDTYRNAENGALAVAIELSSVIKNFINEV